MRWVNLHAHISDNHCLHLNPEYNGRLLSAIHLPLAKLQAATKEQEHEESFFSLSDEKLKILLVFSPYT